MNMSGIVRATALAFVVGAAGCSKPPAPVGAAAASGAAPASVAASGGGAVSVSSVRALAKDVDMTLETTGTISALNSVDIRPQVSSVITQVNIREGQFVKAGQLLFTLDARTDEGKLAAAKAQLAASETSLKRIDLLIKRLTVLAPRDGTIIQVNIRAGEYAATSPKSPAMILGETDRLQVRADIDEQNATRIRAGQKAYGYLKGDPDVTFPLEFIRVEPYVIPKVSLTGSSTERVDTRVLQVIYSLTRPTDPPLYVGQQVDVFIEAPERK